MKENRLGQIFTYAKKVNDLKDSKLEQDYSDLVNAVPRTHSC